MCGGRGPGEVTADARLRGGTVRSMKQTMVSGKHIPHLSKCNGDLQGNQALKPPVPVTRPLALVRHTPYTQGVCVRTKLRRGDPFGRTEKAGRKAGSFHDAVTVHGTPTYTCTKCVPTSEHDRHPIPATTESTGSARPSSRPSPTTYPSTHIDHEPPPLNSRTCAPCIFSHWPFARLEPVARLKSLIARHSAIQRNGLPMLGWKFHPGITHPRPSAGWAGFSTERIGPRRG